MAARSDPSLAEEVASDEQVGVGYEWETTPDFFLGEGTKLAPFHPESAAPSSFAKVIRERLATAER